MAHRHSIDGGHAEQPKPLARRPPRLRARTCCPSDATATRVVPRYRLHFLPRDLPLIGALWAVPATLLILLVIALVRFVRDRGKPE